MKKMQKKKGFVIDKITEDSFYENLLLGLTSVLKRCPFISQIKLDRNAPATLDEVTCWEFTNSVNLPEDLRNFYLSTNGFSFSYKFQYDKNDSEEVSHVLGGIHVNPLLTLQQITTNKTTYVTETGMQIVAPHAKIFVLAQLDEESCVVLSQFSLAKPPTFWLYYRMKSFYFLCEDFTTYFRMALAHLGVPGWQMAVLKASLPEWSAELLQLVAPGVLVNRQLSENQTEDNELDLDIFNEDFDTEVSMPGCVEGKKEVRSLSGKAGRKSAKARVKK